MNGRTFRSWFLGVVLAVFAGACGGAPEPTGPSPAVSPSPTPAPAPTPSRIINLDGNLAFGNVTVGTTKDATLKVTNSGNSMLTVSGLSVTTGLSSAYTASWTNGTIAAGASQTVTVYFAPTAAQSYNGTVAVNADHTGGTNMISISGMGIAATSPTPSPAPSPSPTTSVIQSVIDGTFEGWSGETIFPLANGQYWVQSSYAYVYHYAYRPKVTITKSGTRWILAVEGLQDTVFVEPISGVVSSRINGTFEGWSGDTVFPLTNGQVWQQSRYAYHYHYAYMPDVLIYSPDGGSSYRLKVDGDSEIVSVRRLR